MTGKIEYSAIDAQPIVLYAKRLEADTMSYPVLEGMLNPKFGIPKYDTIALTYNATNDITKAVYSLSAVTVATLTLTYTSGNLTSVVRT